MQRALAVVLSLACLVPAAGVAADDASAATREAPPPAERAAATLPDHVVYWHLFHHVAALDRRAAELEKQGQDGSRLRSFYRDRARLSAAQAGTLSAVASDCDGEVAAQDRRAGEVIRAARARLAGGRLAKGETPPPPPAELAALQEARNAAVLRARDRLRRELGEDEFARFDRFVAARVAPRIRNLSPALRAAAANRRPQP